VVVPAIGLAAVAAGARSFAAIGQWATEHAAALVAVGGHGRSPDESTVRKVFDRLDADGLAAVFGAWLWTRTGMIAGRRVIALDGKTVRGAR